MEHFETGAVRDTGGKGRMDLLPWCALLRISKHMEDANTHYPERNWEKGLPMHSMLDSAMRHLAKYMDGWTDEDHLAAAATNLLMALWTEEKKPNMQDIPSRGEHPVKISTITPSVEGEKCDCYDSGICDGTMDRKECHCGGLLRKCDFYSTVRNGVTNE